MRVRLCDRVCVCEWPPAKESDVCVMCAKSVFVNV